MEISIVGFVFVKLCNYVMLSTLTPIEILIFNFADDIFVESMSSVQ